jgi:DNA-binding response OmpR family regulator
MLVGMRGNSLFRHKDGGPSLVDMLMNADRQPHAVEVGGLRIDRVRFEVRVGNLEERLSRKEFELLWVLASEDGRAFRREEIIDRVWGSGFFIDARTVDVHIARLRTKLKSVTGEAPFIETVWGIGYRLRPSGEAEPQREVSRDLPSPPI